MSEPKHVFDYTEWDTGLSKCRHPDHRGGFSPVCWEANARQAGWISPTEVGDAQATENALVQQVVERERDRAHTAEQSLGEADAEIERLNAVVARVEALAPAWEGLSVAPAGFYAEATAWAEGREAQAESCAEDLRQALGDPQ